MSDKPHSESRLIIYEDGQLYWFRCNEHDYVFKGHPDDFEPCPKCKAPPRAILVGGSSSGGYIATTGLSKEDRNVIRAANPGKVVT